MNFDHFDGKKVLKRFVYKIRESDVLTRYFASVGGAFCQFCKSNFERKECFGNKCQNMQKSQMYKQITQHFALDMKTFE